MDRRSIECLCWTIMRHAKRHGRVRLSQLMEAYDATDLAAEVGLGDCLYSGLVLADVMVAYLWCVFRVAGHALARHELVNEFREGEDVVYELTASGTEVARKGSRALHISWYRFGFRKEDVSATPAAAVSPVPLDDDDDHD